VGCPAADGLPPSKFRLSRRTTAVVKAWEKLSQSFLDKSIGEWRRRLDAVVQQNGGHIEHRFKYKYLNIDFMTKSDQALLCG